MPHTSKPIDTTVLKNIFSIASRLDMRRSNTVDDWKPYLLESYCVSLQVTPDQDIQSAIRKVAQMYWDAQNGAVVCQQETEANIASSSYGPSRGSSSIFGNPSSFNFTPLVNVDNSDRHWGSTTNNYSGTPHSKDKKEKKETTLEEHLIAAGIFIGMAIVTGLAAVALKPLLDEVCNHASRFYHNEGYVLGASLLIGMGLSYCLTMFALYELTGTLLMTAMTAGAFANPAIWAFAAIALTSVIAMPLVNMFVREGIYTLFSLFDSQALVKNDNRFRTLTDVELDTLDNRIDPDRVNFATLLKHKELKLTQTRQRFAFFDTNSDKMGEVLADVRGMRNQSTSVDILHDGNAKKQFYLFKPAVIEDYTPSAPPQMAHAYFSGKNDF